MCSFMPPFSELAIFCNISKHVNNQLVLAKVLLLLQCLSDFRTAFAYGFRDMLSQNSWQHSAAGESEAQ